MKDFLKLVGFTVLGIVSVCLGAVSLVLIAFGAIGWMVWKFLMSEAKRPRD